MTGYVRPALAAAAALAGLLLQAVPSFARDNAGEAVDAYAFTQDYEPAPALWELSDEDTTIYMFGTIHMLPEGFRWRNPQLDAIIDTADALVLETSDADSVEDFAAMGEKFATIMAARTPTSERLSPEARGKWRQLAARTGMPFDYIDSMPLMLVLMDFGLGRTQPNPSSYENGVETVLEREFLESERPVGSIEDSGHVLYGLMRIDDAEAVADLDRALRRWSGKRVDSLYGDDADDAGGDGYWQMEHDWARGRVGEDFDLGFGSGKIAAAFHDVLLNRRNTRWAAWLENRLEQPGTILLAVGAGHFEGSDSLLEKLRERGLRARRIN
ncbi:TraB/GumN family protein [Aurantiacibacter spongiae]|nr:TraB/GumN family protein [Aurantiacibacter spongiae]